MPRPPRPPHSSLLPLGFPILAQGRIGLVVAGRRPLNVHRLPLIFSEVIAHIPHNTPVWVFGERNGWSMVHYNGQFGFVNSRFVILL